MRIRPRPPAPPTGCHPGQRSPRPSMLATLRQPRYAALSLLMLVVAAVCVLAGTWQIARLAGKAQENAQLRHNARAAPVPVETVLPLVATGKAPGRRDVQFRTAHVTGRYDVEHQVVVRERTVNDDSGYLVLTPLRSARGTLLVVRGFISDQNSTVSNPVIPAPPAQSVTVRVRLQPRESRDDQAAHLPAGQVESVNPVEQAARLRTVVYNGYGELLPREPGTSGLVTIPKPDLSNPAGGAIEPQHLAYIIQWYLFAALAIAAPFAMARAETRARDERDFDEAAAAGKAEQPADAPQSAEVLRAAKLADRYGRVVR